MSEPTLAAQFKDLVGDVGYFLGFGRGADNDDAAWDDDQQAAVDRAVKGGLRKFYHCGENWSFLRPTVDVGLPSGASSTPLPDDLGAVEGRITLSSTSQSWCPLDVTNPGKIDERYSAYPSATGRPTCAAVRPVNGTQGDAGQRWELYVFPTADADYTLRFQYYVNPSYLDGSRPYAYGGAQHAETLLEACLAAAESLDDDAEAVHAKRFQEQLEQSKMIDRRNRPQNLGYNGDRSDVVYRRDRTHWDARPTVGGVTY